MITRSKEIAKANFANHLRVAKAACLMAGGVETSVDSIVDELALCLDFIHHTDEFTQMAINN